MIDATGQIVTPGFIDVHNHADDQNRLGTGVNVILFNGHNTLREMAMGKDVKRPANAVEIAKMQEIPRRGLEQEGSFGISPMWWVPSENKGKHPSTLADAVEEVLRVAKETGVITVFTHMKAWGPGFRDAAEKWIARGARCPGTRLYGRVSLRQFRV